jgi:hypothetical protein
MASFIADRNSVTIYLDDGRNMTVWSDHHKFNDIVDFVKRGMFVEAFDAYEAAKQRVTVAIANNSQQNTVQIIGGEVLYKGYPLHNHLTDRIIQMIREGYSDVTPMLRFLENLMNNPSSRAVNELYAFLEYGRLPITEDGHFLAYKKVRDNYTDCHTGKINNKVGQIVEMARNQVDDNCNNTCSSGLHFCSREYLQSFSGSHLMVIKINPADVVSIPVDYNNTKGRCCKYVVVGELEMTDDERNRLEGVYNDDYDFTDDDDADDYCLFCNEKERECVCVVDDKLM